MNTKIYANDIKDDTLKQFREAMAQKCNIKGALMSDAHTGYTLPIGAVIRSKNVIFPAYVGYDIGCGVCAAKLDILASDIDLKALKDEILSRIPLSNHEKEQSVELLPCSNVAKTAFGASGKYQLGTLGSGNHFIEIAKGEDEKLWLVIHSGSRGFGKIIAEYYMKKACEMKFDKKVCEKDFNKKHKKLLEHNKEAFEKSKQKFLAKAKDDFIKANLEGHNGFDINSELGRDYIADMLCAMDFALKNRRAMIDEIKKALKSMLGKMPNEIAFINKCHNFAEFESGGNVLHRKGATSSKLGEYGVIPGNMRDGSFIVRGLGNKDALCSSSHGAGRAMSRAEARKNISFAELSKEMSGILSNHSEANIDEAPRAYKDIFEVMKAQSDLVEIKEHLKPILNIKG